MMRRWLAVLVVASCGRIGFDPNQSDASDASDAAACTLGPFAPPVRLTGAANGPGDEWTHSPALDETIVVFHSYRAPSQGADLWLTTLPDLPYGAIIPELATVDNEFNPSITNDATDMVFIRGVGTPKLYETTRPDAKMGTPWSTPQVVAAIDTGTSNTPFISEDGLRVVFGSSRPGVVGGYDLYESSRLSRADPLSSPVQLLSVESNTNDQCPVLSADGLELYFSSLRPGGPGGYDVYVARRAMLSDDFSTPQLVGPLSSTQDECVTRLTRDGRRMYMNYDALVAGGGNADLWIASRDCQ